MTTPNGIEKFAAADLSKLRSELMHAGLDSWQAAELISSFLIGRGYGVSTPDARHAVVQFESPGCSIDYLQSELEKLAQVM